MPESDWFLTLTIQTKNHSDEGGKEFASGLNVNELKPAF